MRADALFAGIDLGTSGARVCLLTPEGSVAAQSKAAMEGEGRDPQVWWRAVSGALEAALAGVDRARVMALAVDGTSGTMVAVDGAGVPLAPALMYNDACTDRPLLDRIAAHAPAESAAHGATSGLARALMFQSVPGVGRVLHQADWIGLQFSGEMASDENNALKTGYDPVLRHWPGWIADCGLRMGLLPPVHPPGTPLGGITTAAASRFGLSRAVRIVAGTTDGCASFLATGADRAGDAVTALGTTLTLKILSDRPIFAPESGVYSHRVLGKWLAGGASNTGGAVLLAQFTAEQIAALSGEIDPGTPSPLHYYPLLKPGERFPVADPVLQPVLTPRPEADADFLKAMLDGIARIEAEGYARLQALGAPALASIRSVGRGARNAVWTGLRARRLGVPMLQGASDEAALGTARLAQIGAMA